MDRQPASRAHRNARLLRLRLLALLAALSLVAAACGGGEGAAGEDAAAGTAGEEGEAGADGDQVELLVWASRDHSIPADDFARFMEENPGITVNFDVQPGDGDILRQLLRMRDAGEAMPDVMQDDAFYLPAYEQAGFLLPLDDLVQRWQEEVPEEYELVYPNVWEEGMLDGALKHVPLTTNVEVVYYNVPWFEEAGVELPLESWDEFLEAARALKETRPDQIPLSIQGREGVGVTYLFAAMKGMGVPFDDDALPQLTSDEGLYMLDMFLTMADEGLLPPDAIAWGQDESRAEFIAKRAGIVFDGLNTAFDFTEVPGFEYEVDWNATPFPTSRTGASEDGTAQSASRTWFINAETEHPYEASLILRHYAETQTMVEMTPLKGTPPPRQDEALYSDEIREYMPFFTDELIDTFREAAPGPASENRLQIEEVLERMMSEIVSGQAEGSAEEIAERVQGELEALID